MAQALEKIFLQKVAQMPQEEVELLPPPPKGKARKPGAPPASGNWLDVTINKPLELLVTCCLKERFQLTLSLSHPNRKPTINSTDYWFTILVMSELPSSAGSDSCNSCDSSLDHHLQCPSCAPCHVHDPNCTACCQSKTSSNYVEVAGFICSVLFIVSVIAEYILRSFVAKKEKKWF